MSIGSWLESILSAPPQRGRVRSRKRRFRLHVEELEPLVLLSPLGLSPASMPPATAGAPYDQSVTAIGGTTPYAHLSVTGFNAGTTGFAFPTVNVAGGTVTVNSTPRGSGTATFTVNVGDSSGARLSQTETIAVNPALALTPANLPDASAGIAYAQTISLLGGTAPYTALTVVDFDPGTTGLAVPVADLSAGTVTIDSTPSGTGIATFTISASDSAGADLTEDYTIVTPAALSMAPPGLPMGSVGVLYNQAIAISGGSGPYTSVTVTGFDAGSTGLSAPTAATAAGAVIFNSTPSAAGTATFSVSVTDSAGATLTETYAVTVPPPADVLTYHNDNSSSGEYLAETGLTPASVNPRTFGKLYSITLDEQVLAQPLYVAGLNTTTGTNPGTHDVIFAATENDSVYALDAETGAVLWQASLLHSVHGGTVTSVPASDVGVFDSPQIGITSTPVIDPSTNTMYVVAFDKEVAGDGSHYIYQLYALDISNGTEKLGGPVVVADSIGQSYVSGPTIQGTGDGSSGGTVFFDAFRQDQRTALTLANGNIYFAFASFDDQPPYHGWLLSYSAATLQLNGVFNATPNGSDGGIWESGGRIAADQQGNLYLETGNGTFETTLTAPDGFPSLGDYGDSFVKLAIDPDSSATNQNINGWGLKVVDYFTPDNQAQLDADDGDLGSGAPMLLPASVSSPGEPELLVGAGKDGRVYLINTEDMGHFDPTADHVVQETPIGAIGRDFSTAAYYENTIYYTGSGSPAAAFSIGNGTLSSIPTSTSPETYSGNAHGYTAAISANGATDGIVWEVDPGVGQLRAYDAAGGLTQEIYTNVEAANNRDAFGTVAAVFVVPTVADDRVFIGTKIGLVVYGLLPLSLSPSNLRLGTSGTNYNQTVTAFGGTLPYTSLTVTAFKAGTTGLSAPTVILAAGTVNANGTPTSAGAATFTVTVTDSTGASVSRNYRILIRRALGLTPTILSDATAGTAYNQAIAVTGGVTPYTTLTVTSFNAGVTGLAAPTANVAGGMISVAGTPNVAGTVTFTLNVADSAGATLSESFSLTVNGPLSLTPATLPQGTVGAAYTQVISLTGGTAPYPTLTVTGFDAGTTGMSAPTANPSAGTLTIASQPTGPGTVTFSVKATDSAGANVSQSYSVIINPPLGLTPATLAPGTAGASYNQTITVSGGTAPYTSLMVIGFNAANTGLAMPTTNLASDTITVAGTPSGAGTATFTVEATDSAGATLSQVCTIVINPPLSLTPGILPQGTAGTAYSHTILLTGGTAPYTSLIVRDFDAGTTDLAAPTVHLAAGMVVVDGKPAHAGMATFTVLAADSVGATSSQSYTIVINPPLHMTAIRLPSARVGFTYALSIQVSGGTGPYTLIQVSDFHSGGTGFTSPKVDLAAGKIMVRGTAKRGGTVSFEVQATDGAGATLRRTYTIRVGLLIAAQRRSPFLR